MLSKSTEETVFVHSTLFGELHIPRVRIKSILSQEFAASQMNNDAQQQGVEIAESSLEEGAQDVPAHTASVGQSGISGDEVVAAEELTEQRLFGFLGGLNTPDSWSGDLRMGFNISSGDSKWTETLIKGTLDIRPLDSSSLYRYAGAYTYRVNERENGEKFKSQDKYNAEFLYRYTFDNGWFVQNTANWRTDQLKGINRDLSDRVGLGYSFSPLPSIEYNLGGSGGIEDYESSGEDSRNGQNPSLSVFHEFKWTLMERTSLVHTYNYFWNPDNSEQYNFVVNLALRVRLTDLLGFEFSYNKDFDNDTGDGQNKDDTRWLNAMILFF